ncbi:MAG: hypothetical protein WCX77_02325 [Candidatus Paceibacterota bacterium]|jgi:hypothetical protein
MAISTFISIKKKEKGYDNDKKLNLIAELKQGDDQAANKLFKIYSSLVPKVAWSLSQNSDIVSDFSREGYIGLREGIGRTRLYDTRRFKEKGELSFFLELFVRMAMESLFDIFDVANSRLDGLDEFIYYNKGSKRANRKRRKIEAALKSLEIRQRTAVIMYFGLGGSSCYSLQFIMRGLKASREEVMELICDAVRTARKRLALG